MGNECTLCLLKRCVFEFSTLRTEIGQKVWLFEAKPEAEKVQMLVNGIFAAFPVTCDLIVTNLSFSIIDDLWVFQTWTLVSAEAEEETVLFLVLTSANFSY